MFCCFWTITKGISLPNIATNYDIESQLVIKIQEKYPVLIGEEKIVSIKITNKLVSNNRRDWLSGKNPIISKKFKELIDREIWKILVEKNEIEDEIRTKTAR